MLPTLPWRFSLTPQDLSSQHDPHHSLRCLTSHNNKNNINLRLRNISFLYLLKLHSQLLPLPLRKDTLDEVTPEKNRPIIHHNLLGPSLQNLYPKGAHDLPTVNSEQRWELSLYIQ